MRAAARPAATQGGAVSASFNVKNPPPFAGMRWYFWLLVLTPIVVLTAYPCQKLDAPYYGAAWVLWLGSCVWEAHIRCVLDSLVQGKQAVWTIGKRTIRNAAHLLGWTVLLSIPLVFFMPTYQCYTDRARIAELFVLGAPLKQQVEERVRASHTLDASGAGLQVQPAGRLTAGFVTDSGLIVLFSEEPPAVVQLTSKLEDAIAGGLTWACIGYPQKAMPMSCRAKGAP
jgi:hypothetical protein